MAKSLPAKVGDARQSGSIPGLGRSPGEGKSYSLQYSGLENSMDLYSPWGHKESDMTEQMNTHYKLEFVAYMFSLPDNGTLEIRNYLLCILIPHVQRHCTFNKYLHTELNVFHSFTIQYKFICDFIPCVIS